MVELYLAVGLNYCSPYPLHMLTNPEGLRCRLNLKIGAPSFFHTSPCWTYPTLLKEGLSISAMIEMSVLAFTGEVVEMEFVFRENLPLQFTTAITVEVEEMIKGTPNAGENRVKFMIRGGEGVHPTIGESLICIAIGAPQFEIGKKVLIFLLRHTRLIEHRRLRQLSPPPMRDWHRCGGETEKYWMRRYLCPIRSRKDYLRRGSGGMRLG